MTPRTHLGASALAGVLVEALMRPAGGGLRFTHTLTGVLVQVVEWSTVCCSQLFSAYTLTGLLIQLFVRSTKVLLSVCRWREDK